MEIILLRHGKPVIPSLQKVIAADFALWVEAYNASGLCPASQPSEAVLDIIKHQAAIVTSTLPRSIESAKSLSTQAIYLTSAQFNEADLPIVNIPFIKLSPKIWAVIFRIIWLLGYASHAESYKKTRLRAADAVDTLIAIAEQHERVLFVGHGVYNRILAKQLRAGGWSGPVNPGSRHWSFAIYHSKG